MCTSRGSLTASTCMTLILSIACLIATAAGVRSRKFAVSKVAAAKPVSVEEHNDDTESVAEIQRVKQWLAEHDAVGKPFPKVHPVHQNPVVVHLFGTCSAGKSAISEQLIANFNWAWISYDNHLGEVQDKEELKSDFDKLAHASVFDRGKERLFPLGPKTEAAVIDFFEPASRQAYQKWGIVPVLVYAPFDTLARNLQRRNSTEARTWSEIVLHFEKLYRTEDQHRENDVKVGPTNYQNAVGMDPKGGNVRLVDSLLARWTLPGGASAYLKVGAGVGIMGAGHIPAIPRAQVLVNDGGTEPKKLAEDARMAAHEALIRDALLYMKKLQSQ